MALLNHGAETRVLIRDLTLPFQLATALLNHGAETRVLIHELLEGLGESLGSNLTDIHGEHNEVEVSLNVAHDLLLEVGLPVITGHIISHLGLDDALTDVLDTSATHGRSGQVNQLVYLSLGNLGSREGLQQFFDDVKLTHLHRVSVLLNLDINTGEAELLLLEGVQDIIGNNTSHSLQLSAELKLLEDTSNDNTSGGSGDTSLAVEHNRAGSGGLLQQGNNLVKVLLCWGLLLVHGDPQSLKLGNLLLELGIDFIECGDRL